MYDATIGRWLSQDPIGFEAGDDNLYRYVGNNPTNAVDPCGLATLRVEVGDKENAKPQWGFSIKFTVREIVEPRKPMKITVEPLTITGQLSSFRAQDFVTSGVIKAAKIAAKGEYRFKKDQKYLVYIEEPEAPKEETGAIAKYIESVGWVSVPATKYQTTKVYFQVLEQSAVGRNANVEITALSRGGAIGVKFDETVKLVARGFIELAYVPGHKSSYAKVTIGRASSGVVAGTGYASGNWHYPKVKTKAGTGASYTPIKTPPTDIVSSNPKTAWSFEWENEP